MAPLRGSLWVLVLYDVAEEILLDKLPGLVSGERSAAQPRFKHPAPDYVRFEKPPVVEIPRPISSSTGEQFQVRIKYFDYGVISVELELAFETDWDDLIRLSNRWILAPETERLTFELLQARLEKVAEALHTPYPNPLNEDYYIIHLREARDAELPDTGLARADQLSLLAHREVDLGQAEAVGVAHECGEPAVI